MAAVRDGDIIRLDNGKEIRIHSHAAARMRERSISTEEVVEIYFDYQSRYPDADHPDRFSLIGRTAGNRVIRLVFKNVEPPLLITVIDVRGQSYGSEYKFT